MAKFHATRRRPHSINLLLEWRDSGWKSIRPEQIISPSHFCYANTSATGVRVRDNSR
jgi:hypothetical protein